MTPRILLGVLVLALGCSEARESGRKSGPFKVTLPMVKHSPQVSLFDDQTSKPKGSDIVVYTADGALRGKRSNFRGTNYYSFIGIRYATPVKRFQAAVPTEPWTGIKNATDHGSPCLQQNDLIKQMLGGEDCLYLDVHTKKLDGVAKGAVIVWIHGGMFKFGMGANQICGPHYLVKQDLVVVNINYRMGPLGFLTSETEKAPGNAGLKDVVEALKWIKRNIDAFGGDPDKVTVLGASTGSMMAELLELSPMARGLFSKAILYGGSSLSDISIKRQPLRYTFHLGSVLGYNTTDIDELIDLMSAEDPEKLILASKTMEAEYFVTENHLVFAPTVEVPIPGVEPFLVDYPQTLLKSGNYTKVPNMIGFCNYEGIYFYKDTNDLIKFNRRLENLFEYLLPDYLMTDIRSSRCKNRLLKHVRDFYYPNGGPISEETINGTINLMGDKTFLVPILKSVSLKADASDKPIYVFEFAYSGSPGKLRNKNLLHIKGSGHSEMLLYFIKMSMYEPEQTKESLMMIDRITGLFANFAKGGNPVPDTSKLYPTKWMPTTRSDKIRYMSITNNMVMFENPFSERYKFWTELYKMKCDCNNDA